MLVSHLFKSDGENTRFHHHTIDLQTRGLIIMEYVPWGLSLSG